MYCSMADTEEFSLDLEVRGKPVTVEGRLRQSTFTYQFLFDIEGTELIVEKDDQGELRAFAPGIRDGQKPPDQLLVKAILAEMEKQFS